MLLPVLVGLVGVLLPAFGYFPALGGTVFTLEPWIRLFAEPGIWTASALGLFTGLASTAISLALVVLLLAAGQTWIRRLLQGLLAPLVAVPHIALGVGLTFLLMPSGWLVRLATPWPSGWERPPSFPFPHDSDGLALILGLVVKETPFLLLVALAALPRLDEERRLVLARSLGYSPVTAWLKTVLPDLLQRLRLPLFAVVAYGVSNVEMALILGPGTPPTLAVLVLEWFQDPDLAKRFLGSAAALLQLAVVGLALAIWWALLGALAFVGQGLAADGRRGLGRRSLPIALYLTLPPLLLVTLLSLVMLLIWSFADRWRFPAVWPSWSFATWLGKGEELAAVAGGSLALALASSLIALLLTFAALECETSSEPNRRDAKGPTLPRGLLAVLAVPLLVPQIAFLFGTAVAAAQLGLRVPWVLVLWGHLLFVLPYVYLALADPYRALDRRYLAMAASLGKGRWAAFLQVKLPLLLRPVLTAGAIGVAVSIALYLPTVLLGGGRVATLASEAVTLSSGGDRRLLAVTALVQAVIPLLAIALAIWLGGRSRQGRAL
ncbi:MAG: ABC transporter permease subunit [Rhodospirillales bacterium]